jgi:hypothetical protein
MKLSSAFGQSFDVNKLRTRSFVLNGHTFKVRVPLAVELEQMFERINEPDAAKVEEVYKDLSKPFADADSAIVERTDNDIVVSGRSLREAARAKAVTEARILEMFKLLVPEEEGFDMSSISYDMVQEAFPFAIQLEMMEVITKTISPDYKEQRGK